VIFSFFGPVAEWLCGGLQIRLYTVPAQLDDADKEDQFGFVNFPVLCVATTI
jgi:hypothetical protein|tara:strand:+ start:94 stop:249 length:156 start_codon:yes stop_codon:yes gene_type:complete